MAHDVFLSYSSKDKIAADAACNVLERNGVRVWMAPRDILVGFGWASSIIIGINGARVMVLVFSTNANTSPQVEREVERAINKGLPVVPFRVENVEPSGALEYFISTPHWLDAFTAPLEQHLERLAEAVKRLLATEYVRARPDETAFGPAQPHSEQTDEATSLPEPLIDEEPHNSEEETLPEHHDEADDTTRAQEEYQAWEEYEADKSARAVGRSAQERRREVAETGEARPVAEPATEPAPAPPFELAAARAMIASGQTPPAEWWPLITNLLFSLDEQFNDLTPLSGLKKLKQLHISYTLATDLAALSDLTDLFDLSCVGPEIADLRSLARLINLTFLDLCSHQVMDLAPLSALVKLHSLALNGEKITDISPLARLRSLNSLSLSTPGLADISPLSSLTNLRSLTLSLRKVNDFTPLVGLKELHWLSLFPSTIENLDFVSALTGLKTLNLAYTQVQNLEPLAGLTALETLDLTYTRITEIAPLAKLHRLRGLSLKGTRVTDVTPLSHIVGLKISR